MRSPEVPDHLGQIQTNNFQEENLQEAADLTKKEKEIHQIAQNPQVTDPKDVMKVHQGQPGLMPTGKGTTAHQDLTREKILVPQKEEEMTAVQDLTRERLPLHQTDPHMEQREAGINPVKMARKGEKTAVLANSPTEGISHSVGMMIKEVLPLVVTEKILILQGKKPGELL